MLWMRFYWKEMRKMLRPLKIKRNPQMVKLLRSLLHLPHLPDAVTPTF